MKNLFFVLVFSFITVLGYTQADISQGLKFIANENYTEAQKFFEGIASKEPKNGAPYYYLGEIKYILEDYNGAEEAYKKGLLVNNKCVECKIGEAKIKLDKGMKAEVDKALEGIAKSNKKDPRILALIGDAYLNSKKRVPAKAIEFYTRARDVNPKSATIWPKLGDAHKANGDSGSAMSAYETAVEKDPKNIEAFMKMAEIWSNSRQSDLAIEKLDAAIKLKDDFAPAYKLMYTLLLKKNDRKRMLPYLEKYTQLAGDDVKAKERLVKFLAFDAKDYDRSIEEGEKLLKTNPEMYTVYRWLAWSYGEKGEWEKSYENSKKLFAEISKNKDRQSYQSDWEYYAKASLNTMDKDSTRLDEATKAYEKVLEFEPASAEKVWGDFAKKFYDNKQYAKAVTYFEKKNAAKPLSGPDLYTLGSCYNNLKKYKEAANYYSKYTAVNGSWAPGWYSLARATENMEDKDNPTGAATAHYTKYLEVLGSEKSNPNNKRNVINAYDYIGSDLMRLGDYTNAKPYFDMILALEPTNTRANFYLNLINTGGK